MRDVLPEGIVRKMKLYNREVSETEENGRRITLLSLAAPLLLENVLMQFYGTANTMLLQGYAEAAVTAVAVSESVVNVAIMLLTMIIKGSVILTSVFLGKKQKEQAAQIAGTALMAVMAAALCVSGALSLFAPRWISLMNLTGATAVEAARYLRIRGAGLLLTTLMSALNNLLIANGRSRSIIVAGVLSNVVNIGLCYTFLYTNIPLPVSGVEAVAVASILSQLFGAVVALLLFCKAKCPYQTCFRPKILGKILMLGIPGGMCNLSYTLCQAITTGFTVQLGELVVNAKVYISNIVIYTSRISLAIGGATGILAGRYRGAGWIDKIRRLYRQNVRLAVLCNMTLSALVFLLCRPLLSLFTDQQQIVAIAMPILLLDIMVEGARAVNHITENALNANGDVRSTLILSTTASWLFSVALAYLLGIVCQLGLMGIWLGFAAEEAFKALAYSWCWKREGWLKRKL